MTKIDKTIKKNRSLFIFFITLLISWILLAMDNGAVGQSVRKGIQAIFSPIQATVSFVKRLAYIEKQNEELHLILTKLALKNNTLRAYEYENMRLRKLLAFQYHSNFILIPAEIISLKGDRIINSIIINKGTKEGIKKNMPAITHNGLAGKVAEVWSDKALIHLLLDRNCKVSCAIQRNASLGILEWEKGYTCNLINIPRQTDVKIGDHIISSGFGGIFPRNIPVGQIISIKPDPTHLLWNIEVQLFVDFNRLEEIFIITGNYKGDIFNEREKQILIELANEETGLDSLLIEILQEARLDSGIREVNSH